MVKETELKSFEVRQYCDKCGEELTFTGKVSLTNPEKYVHKCKKCGNIEWFLKSYPCIEYKEEKNNSCVVKCNDDFENTLNHVGLSQNNKNKEESKSKEIIFNLNQNEVNDYYKFVSEHKKCKCSATIGGKISIIFTPTGLGNAKSVKCNVCGVENEITDVNNW